MKIPWAKRPLLNFERKTYEGNFDTQQGTRFPDTQRSHCKGEESDMVRLSDWIQHMDM